MNSVSIAPINSRTRVLVVCDIDVPIKNGEIVEKFRLNALLPTLKLIIEKGAHPIIAGHMKDGQSTQVLIPYFDENLGKGKYQLLENLRLDPGEQKNDPAFSQKLAKKADIYVNEIFSTSHREHASIVGVPKLLPSYAGLRLEKEVENLSKIMKNPKRPLVAVIGGAKLESKLPLVQKFIQTADAVLLGGKLFLDWRDEVPTNLRL